MSVGCGVRQAGRLDIEATIRTLDFTLNGMGKYGRF